MGNSMNHNRSVSKAIVNGFHVFLILNLNISKHDKSIMCKKPSDSEVQSSGLYFAC